VPRLGVEEVLKPVPSGVVHEHVDRLAAERFFCLRVGGDVEDQGTAVHLAGHFLRGIAVAVGDEHARALLGEATADCASDGAAAARDQHAAAGKPLHFGRLSITRLALPIERSMAPIFTSALMPMVDLMWCRRVMVAPASPSTRTVRWSSGPSLLTSST